MREITLLRAASVADLDAEAATALIAARDPALPLAYVVSVNAQIMILAEESANGLAAAHAGAWLRLNDSRVLARLQRLVGGEAVPVAAGSDITRLLLERVIRPEDPITIIGGGPEIVAALRARFGLTQVAQHEPPMGFAAIPEARAAAVAFARAHPARFLFVATGAPRSELLMAQMVAEGGVTGVGLAVGSGLLFAVGLTRRAPEWMQRAGLEWLHRAWTEPMRLGRRYAADLPPLLRLTWRAWRRGA
ncbi:WecB/TagA/CpsF family glycosyltransferase [Sediminicoccus sp. BL-A-41-H5]|uniref:WecB/TagA/CpsF family glycosyltransferase n=1 Tax=Sediminicoccus sp. BL-A-41-H5 TaxID=3421106 RepID=UPI003D669AE1